MLANNITLPAVNLKDIWKNPFAQNYQTVITKELNCAHNGNFEINHENGDITISCWKQSKIIIEATISGEKQTVKSTKIQAKCQDNKVSTTHITTGNIRIDYHILLPEAITLSCVATQNGSIKIKHSKGPINVSTQNGDIEIINSTKTVIVQNSKGNTTIKQMKLPKKSAIIIDSTVGNVELSLPASINANLDLQTTRGSINSEQKIKLNEKEMSLNRSTWDELSKNIEAKLGDGGAAINVKISQRGDISITKY